MTAKEYQELTARNTTEKPPNTKNVTNTVQSPLKGGNRGYRSAAGLLNAVWLKSDTFPYVADCGTHLEGQCVDGQWYRLDLTKIDKPSKS